MLFMVEMQSSLGGVPLERERQIREQELVLALDYMNRGLLRAVWRLVGRDGNFSL